MHDTRQGMNVGHAEISVADSGCFSQIQDPNFSIQNPRSRILDLRSRVKKAPDPGSRNRISNKECKYFNPNMIRDGFHGFRIFSIPDPGVKKALDPGP
jgi:hypothetical protein